jgi:hypothetical protein
MNGEHQTCASGTHQDGDSELPDLWSDFDGRSTENPQKRTICLCDPGFRKSQGLEGLGREVLNGLVQAAYERLERRVEGRILTLLTQDQAAKLEALFGEDSFAEAFDWLREIVPTYDEIVRDEVEALNRELEIEAKIIAMPRRREAAY